MSGLFRILDAGFSYEDSDRRYFAWPRPASRSCTIEGRAGGAYNIADFDPSIAACREDFARIIARGDSATEKLVRADLRRLAREIAFAKIDASLREGLDEDPEDVAPAPKSKPVTPNALLVKNMTPKASRDIAALAKRMGATVISGKI